VTTIAGAVELACTKRVSHRQDIPATLQEELFEAALTSLRQQLRFVGATAFGSAFEQQGMPHLAMGTTTFPLPSTHTISVIPIGSEASTRETRSRSLIKSCLDAFKMLCLSVRRIRPAHHAAVINWSLTKQRTGSPQEYVKELHP